MFFTTVRRFALVGLLIASFGMANASASAAQPTSTPSAHDPAQERPVASPWREVTSVNTDPRVDWVTVSGPAEGQQFAAVCIGQSLLKVRANEDAGISDKLFETEAQSFAPECTDDYITYRADRARVINTDPSEGWVALPIQSYGPHAEANAVVTCVNGTPAIIAIANGIPVSLPARTSELCGPPSI